MFARSSSNSRHLLAGGGEDPAADQRDAEKGAQAGGTRASIVAGSGPVGPAMRGVSPAVSWGRTGPAWGQSSIASSSSMKPSIIDRPLSQKVGSLASSPKGASSSLWCIDPPARSMSKYLS